MRDRFRALHEAGLFVMPNPWDIGSAKVLAAIGFQALATTSSGHAGTLGRPDQQVTRDELIAHVEELAAAAGVPISVDAERCFPGDAGGVTRTAQLLADAGAAGFSIEDYDPATRTIDPLEKAVEAVAAVAAVAAQHGLVLTARAENHLYGHNDLDNTIERLIAYREAGAEVVYAPGLRDLDQIAEVVKRAEAAVNVLLLADGPSVPELAEVGVRRVSTGGSLFRAAMGALVRGGRVLLDEGRQAYFDDAIPTAAMTQLFSFPPRAGED